MDSGYTRLLNLMWRIGHFCGRDFTAVADEQITVVRGGEYDDESGVWYGAEIVVDGERRRGDVIVGDAVSSDRAILRVVSGYSQPMLDFGDRLIPQIGCFIDPPVLERYEGLMEGSGQARCAGIIAEMDSLHRTDLFTKLLVDRLRRKCGDVTALFEASGRDWNQTFYVMLLRSMGGDRNRDAFTDLASRVTYVMVAREKSSHERVEALLLGGSGFLAAADQKDAYTLNLENEFRHLANKYSLRPLKPAEWNLTKLYPRNHPALRLAELAALLAKKDFLLDNMLACRSAADVERLFDAEASEYWLTHYRPGVVSKASPKRIGKAKARLIGINLVAPLMFTYGKETGNEDLCERAVDLLETMPPESNEKIDAWVARGCVPENGFESQALLQLNNEFCAHGGCADCYVGRGEIKKALQRLS